ncbi:MAG: hypothetical protein REH83_01855 [Rickettsiella sp.]|nr:hypothetical protein [Rickettsiella sp.]
MTTAALFKINKLIDFFNSILPKKIKNFSTTMTIDPVTFKTIQDELTEGNIYYISKKYQTIYSFTNNLPMAIPMAFNTSGSDADFIFNGGSCVPTLGAKQECRLTITFIPKTTGSKKISLIVDVSGREYIKATKKFNVTVEEKVHITSEILQDLPPQAMLGTTYPFLIRFSVTGSRSATAVSVVPIDDSAKQFVLNTPIHDKVISQNQPLTVEGTFTPQQKGSKQKVGVLLAYKEGEDISRYSSETNVVEKKGGVEFTIQQDLPQKSKVGTTIPFAFSITNKTDIPATNITVTLTKKD